MGAIKHLKREIKTTETVLPFRGMLISFIEIRVFLAFEKGGPGRTNVFKGTFDFS